MTRLSAVNIAAFAAFLTALVAGVICRRLRAASSATGLTPETEIVRAALLAIAPLAAGLLVGGSWLLVFSGILFHADRFHSVGQSRVFCLALILLSLVLLTVDLVAPRTPVDYGERRTVAKVRNHRWLLFLIMEFACAGIAVLSGVRFPILGIAGSEAMELGIWAAPLTVLWIVVGINAAKLLDGIHGAASVLLLFAAVTVCISTRDTSEYFLYAFSTMLAGAVAGTLPHNIYPAPLRLSGGGTACIGFLFATLTVLARQKSVAALAVIFPLLLSVLLIGAAMFGLLERNLVLKEDDE